MIEEQSNQLATVPICEFTAGNPLEMYTQMSELIPSGSCFVSAHLIGATVFIIYAPASKPKPIKKKRIIRDSSTFRILQRFKLINLIDEPVKFYFENLVYCKL